MDVAVICRPSLRRKYCKVNSVSERWHQHRVQIADVELQVLHSRRAILGLRCGWTNWRDGWAIWSAEKTTFLELRRELSISASVDDASVMRAALDRWGLAAREHTHSMWAGAIWQKSRAELCFFRDHIGLTPAFYCHDISTQSHVFSTSMTLIHELCPKSKTVNQNRLHSFLQCQNDSRRHEFFETVCRLRPGESWHQQISGKASVLKAPKVRRYWQPGLEKSEISDQVTAAQFLLGKLQSISADYLAAGYDPVSFVSGGLDSTLMLSVQVEQARKMRVEPERIAAATMGFPSFPLVDETVWTDQLQTFVDHPIRAINVEDCWPMSSPSIYVDRPELGPSFHPGETYESAFIGRSIEQIGKRPGFWGVGADQLFKVKQHLVLSSIFNHSKMSLENRFLLAKRHASTIEIAEFLLKSTEFSDLLRPAYRLLKRSRRMGRFPWRTPNFWVITNADRSSNRFQKEPDNQDDSFLSNENWELASRGFRRKTYRWRVSQHVPYLRTDYIDAVLGMNPFLLNDGMSTKGLLRRMAKWHLPMSIRLRPKGGVFSKVVEFGLGCMEFSEIEQLFGTESALGDLQLIEPSLFLKAFASYRGFCWSNQGQDQNANEMFMWRTIAAELWCRQLM